MSELACLRAWVFLAVAMNIFQQVNAVVDTPRSSVVASSITVRNEGSTKRWLHISEIEVFAASAVPDSNTGISSNRIKGLSINSDGWTGTPYETSCNDGSTNNIPTCLYDGQASGTTYFALNGWSADAASNSVTVNLPTPTSIGIVRIWQRAASCCLDRLENINVVARGASGADVSNVSYPGRPESYVEVNFQPGSKCSNKTVYVSPTGSDSNFGCSADSAKRSISTCALAAGNGGTCYLMPGTYRGTAIIKGLSALTLKPAPGSAPGSVLLDGTIPIEGGWSETNGVFTSNQPQTVWQLFLGREALTSARWPNANMWTSAAWSRDRSWATQLQGTSCGHSVDGGTLLSPQHLNATGASMNGCNLIMNNEHWVTRRYVVANHVAGTGEWDYEVYQNDRKLCDKYGSDIRHSRYFIDGCLAALDAPGEWAYNSAGYLVVKPPAGIDFASASVHGKNQTYALVFDQCEQLTISGLSFFGTALLVHDSPKTTISGNTFKYSAASRRSMGGAATEIDILAEYGLNIQGSTQLSQERQLYIPGIFVGGNYNTETKFLDNYVEKSESSGVYLHLGKNDLVENNEFVETAYPFGRAISYFGFQGYQTARRNTINTDGAGGIGQMWGHSVVSELNHIWGSGRLVVDNQGIGGGKPSEYNVMKYNWVHDSTGLGLRFDAGEDGNFGHHNDMLFNVVWNNLQGGMAGKSNDAVIYRNTAISNQGGTDPEATGAFGSAADMKICACYPADCKASSGSQAGLPDSAQTNKNSTIRANVGQMDPATTGRTSAELPGTHDHNLNLYLADGIELHELFRDWSNMDFRPKAGGPLVNAGAVAPGVADMATAPDIGAYEMGASTYWIPGRQYEAASTPIPPTGASGVQPDADLMFLQGRIATSHDIFVGDSEATLQFVASLKAPINIYTPASQWAPSKTYYWKVVAVLDGGIAVSSAIWNFTAGCADPYCTDCGIASSKASCLSCKTPYAVQNGICAPKGGCSSGYWDIKATPRQYGDVRTFSSAGKYTDSITTSTEPSDGCAKHGLELRILLLNGEKLGALSCSNQEFDVSKKFACNRCATGFVADSSVPSECSPASREPRPAPSVPTPAPSMFMPTPKPKPTPMPALTPAPTLAPTLAPVPSTEIMTCQMINQAYVANGCCGNPHRAFSLEKTRRLFERSGTHHFAAAQRTISQALQQAHAFGGVTQLKESAQEIVNFLRLYLKEL